MGMFTNDDDFEAIPPYNEDCSHCQGKGYVFWSSSLMGAKEKCKCDHCNGTGKIKDF